MNIRGDSIGVMQSLFQETESGSIPTSPLQLRFEVIEPRTAAVAYRKWHYLGAAGFLSQINFGAYFNGELEGAISYGPLSAPAMEGYWDRNTQAGWYEIKRLAMSPDCPHNSESRFIGKTILLLRKRCIVSGIVTYADSGAGHTGIIYKASGFQYMGLTAPKTDFWVGDVNVGQRRGGIKGKAGDWRPRSRKHLFIKKFGVAQ